MPPPTSYSSVVNRRPFSIADALAVVPPMSRVMTSPSPIMRLRCSAPITPAAGPHSMIRTGCAMVVAASSMPPLDCMIISGVLHAPRAQPVHDLADVAMHRRPDIGVDDRGAGALVLADLRQDLARQGDEGLRHRRAQPQAHLPLVIRVGMGMQKAHRHRLDLERAQRVHDLAHLVRHQRDHDLAAGPDPFRDLEAQMARHQRRRLLPQRIVEPRHADPAQLQHVAKAAGGQQRAARALALQDRVGGDGAAMQHGIEAGGIERQLAGELRHALHDRRSIVVRSRGQLVAGHQAGVGDEGHVGERAADIDRHAPRSRAAWNRPRIRHETSLPAFSPSMLGTACHRGKLWFL